MVIGQRMFTKYRMVIVRQSNPISSPTSEIEPRAVPQMVGMVITVIVNKNTAPDVNRFNRLDMFQKRPHTYDIWGYFFTSDSCERYDGYEVHSSIRQPHMRHQSH